MLGEEEAHMNRRMEKITVLSLSFMLTTTFSVTPLLPLMQKAFPAYSTDQVEMLVSIPSFCMMLMILGSNWIYRFASEKFWITQGLILLSVAGVVPVFVESYPVIFASRAFLGIGLGLVNGRAVSMISERFEGREKVTLLGYRASIEVAGNILMTLVVGRLLLIRWNLAFCIYGFGVVILVLYLRFLPEEPKGIEARSAEKTEQKQKNLPSRSLSGKEVVTLLRLVVTAGFMILVNSVISLRVPSFVLERGIGNESDSSIVLSILMVASIVAGVLFGQMRDLWKQKLEAVGLIGLGLSLLLIVSSHSLLVLTVGAALSGFFYMIPLTCCLNGVSEELPIELVSLTTSLVLVGCNLAASTSPLVLKLIAWFDGHTETPYLVFAGISFGGAVVSSIQK